MTKIINLCATCAHSALGGEGYYCYLRREHMVRRKRRCKYYARR